MNTLQLPLKTKWFEMTKAGIKTEDYREINEYWTKRLFRDVDKTELQDIIKGLQEGRSIEWAGFSEKVFDIMKLMEQDKKALMNEIKKVSFPNCFEKPKSVGKKLNFYEIIKRN